MQAAGGGFLIASCTIQGTAQRIRCRALQAREAGRWLRSPSGSERQLEDAAGPMCESTPSHPRMLESYVYEAAAYIRAYLGC